MEQTLKEMLQRSKIPNPSGEGTMYDSRLEEKLLDYIDTVCKEQLELYNKQLREYSLTRVVLNPAIVNKPNFR